MREQDIQTDKRFLAFARSQSISDVYDALVEIITNSDDSYHRLHKAGKLAKDGGDILVEIQHRRQRPSLVVVRDKAEGMTLEDMQKKLGIYGARTSGEGDRGFMSRGLKDCTFLGNVAVDSIVDDKHYACQLTQRDFKFRPLANAKKVTAALRRDLGIEKKNGTVVTLEYSVKVPLPVFDTIRRVLPTHYALRDIAASGGPSTLSIRKIGDGRLQPMRFAKLQGEEIFDEKDIPVMSYPKANFRFRLWKSPTRHVDHDPPRLRKSGVVIKGERAVHQCTLFDCEREELAKHYHGRIDCPYIDVLLSEWDEREKSGQEHPADNPMPVVDSNRRGLMSRHPFTIALFKRAGDRLREQVERDRRELSKKSGDVTDEDMRRRLGELAKATDRFWREENVDEGEESPENDAFGNALERGMYVLPPGFKIEVGEERTLTVYFRRTSYDEKVPTRVQTSNGSVIAVTQSLAKRIAKPHRKREDIVSASFKVKGITEGEATITVVHGKLQPAEARGAVVSERDVNAPEYESPLGFQRKRYEIDEGTVKTLTLFADWPAVMEHGLAARVKSDAPARVPVLHGGECTLAREPGKDYAVGEIKVEGREITQSPAVITARLGKLEILARTKVTVKERRQTSGGFSYELRDETFDFLRAWWAELEGRPKHLIISSVHPSIKPYADRQKDPATRALLAELITEAVCNKLLLSQMRTQPGKFQRALENKEPHEVLVAVNEEFHKRVSKFSAIAHKILVGDLG